MHAAYSRGVVLCRVLGSGGRLAQLVFQEGEAEASFAACMSSCVSYSMLLVYWRDCRCAGGSQHDDRLSMLAVGV